LTDRAGIFLVLAADVGAEILAAGADDFDLER
jgi:hypothetical protein